MVLGSKDLSCPNVVSHNASNASPLTPNLSHKCRLTAPRAKNQFAKLKSNLHQKVQHNGNPQNFICSSNVFIINITNLTEFCGTKKPLIRENRELRIYLFHLEMPRLCQVRRGLFTFPRHETFGWWTNQIIKFTAGPQTIRVRQDLSFQVTHHTSKGLQFCQVEGKL